MELIIALALFIGLIVTWLMLPGSTSTSTASLPKEGTVENTQQVHQPA